MPKQSKIDFSDMEMEVLSVRIPKEYKRFLRVDTMIRGITMQDMFYDILTAYFLNTYKVERGEEAFDELVKEAFPSFVKMEDNKCLEQKHSQVDEH